MGKILLVTLVLAVAGFMGCGDTGPEGPAGPIGPPGPSTILAYADIDIVGPTTHHALAFGPSNRVDSVLVEEFEYGHYGVSVWGTFPDEMGNLIVSASSDQGIVPNINVVATLTSWDAATIMFQVQTWNTDTQVLDDEDFSFVIFGE